MERKSQSFFLSDKVSNPASKSGSFLLSQRLSLPDVQIVQGIGEIGFPELSLKWTFVLRD